jgi:hypothetical protein
MSLKNPTDGGIRSPDQWGEGHYGAPRAGGKIHAGVDVAGQAGQQFDLPFQGKTQAIGQGFDRGMLVTHPSGQYRALLLHGNPQTMTVMNPAQFGYHDMTPHIHFQLEQFIGGHWRHVNPTPFLFPYP